MRCDSARFNRSARAVLCAAVLCVAVAPGCGDSDASTRSETRSEDASPEDAGQQDSVASEDSGPELSAAPDAQFYMEDAEHDHEHPPTATPLPPPSGATCPDDSTLTYESFGGSFMQDYCLECHSRALDGLARHGAPWNRNFDSLEDIVPIALFIDQHAAAGPDSVNTMMPPADHKQPSMAERELLGQWLACEFRKRLGE